MSSIRILLVLVDNKPDCAFTIEKYARAYVERLKADHKSSDVVVRDVCLHVHETISKGEDGTRSFSGRGRY
jgi:hypothetical protein